MLPTKHQKFDDLQRCFSYLCKTSTIEYPFISTYHINQRKSLILPDYNGDSSLVEGTFCSSISYPLSDDEKITWSFNILL